MNTVKNIYDLAIKRDGLNGVIDYKPSTFLIKNETLISATPFYLGSIVNYNNKNYMVIDTVNEFNQSVYWKGTIDVAQDIKINGVRSLGVVKLANQITVSETVQVLDDKYSFKTPTMTYVDAMIEYKKKLYKVSSIDDTKDGLYTIYAKYNGLAKSYSITLSETSTSLNIGKTYQLSPTCKVDNVADSSPVITYTSLNPSIATVNSSGLITTVGEGTTRIEVDYQGEVALFEVNVLANVYAISITNKPTSLNTGTTYSLIASCTLNGEVVSNPTITYSSDNPSVATVSNSGVITGVMSGNVNIKATYEGASTSFSLVIEAVSLPTYTIESDSGAFAVGRMRTRIFTAHRLLGSTEDTSATFTFSFTSPNASITVNATTGNSITIYNGIGYVSGSTNLIVKYNGEVVITQPITFSK
ncbi:Ig-like domain-containing protein [Clostridium cibarium]|uniref:Ig-like domain-containing protein n=1 Tax=Clostridium cibarium TaxID=2762247 RepID=A0ABR8PNI0_9CLOT|nr:Ig-like domain-containing protein [Clostridium cibarium]MBD7909726.1 Ig-like domain-containing protein [Clostridium cibarium]